MSNARISSKVIPLVTLLALAGASSCRPLLDGGWQGTATCNGDAVPLTGVFNEDSEGELDGVVYIEGLLFGFIT